MLTAGWSLARRDALSMLAGGVAYGVAGKGLANSRAVFDFATDLRSIRAGVLEIAYVDTGPRSGMPVVLLHGFPYDIYSFCEVVPVLAQAGMRVIVPYLRGFGATRFLRPDTPRVGQQAALGGDLIALLDALDIHRAVLAGFDWGARSACVVAALYPKRVAGLVTSGGPGYNIQDQTAFLMPRPLDWERQHWFYYYLNAERGMASFSRDPAAFCRYLWQSFSPTWHFDDVVFRRTAISFANPDFVEVALHSYRFRIGGVSGDPALESVERSLSGKPIIEAPTIVLQGADEGIDHPEKLEEIRPHFKRFRRATVIKGVGHNCPQESPLQFAHAVLELI